MTIPIGETGPLFALAVLLIYAVPLLICIVYRGGVACGLIAILLVTNVGLALMEPALVYYALVAVMWSVAALIAAMAVFTDRIATALEPFAEIGRRAKARADTQE